MTDHPDPVETLARALYDSSGLFFPWDSLAPEAHEMFRNKARALLAQITPALVAEAVAQERAHRADIPDLAEHPDE